MARELISRLLPSDAPQQIALFLDVDGTLVGFSPTPAVTSISPAMRQLLDTLTAQLGGAVAIVSGRSMQDLARLFPDPTFAHVGAHGGEIRTPAGLVARAPAPDAVTMATVRAAMQRAVASDPRLYFEDKGASLALHYRRAPECEQQVRELVTTLGREASGLRIQWGAAVAELRGDSFDKGSAVESLLGMQPFQGRRPWYFGDDDTDLPALQYVASAGGTAITVGDRLRSRLPANFYQPIRGEHLDGPSAVWAVLRELSGALSSAPQ